MITVDVATMGSNGSLAATVIESELTLSGINVEDFTQAVQDHSGILCISRVIFSTHVGGHFWSFSEMGILGRRGQKAKNAPRLPVHKNATL